VIRRISKEIRRHRIVMLLSLKTKKKKKKRNKETKKSDNFTYSLLTTDDCFFNNKIYFYIGKGLLWKENCCCYANSFERIRRKNTARIVRAGKIGTIATETKVQRE